MRGAVWGGWGALQTRQVYGAEFQNFGLGRPTSGAEPMSKRNDAAIEKGRPSAARIIAGGDETAAAQNDKIQQLTRSNETASYADKRSYGRHKIPNHKQPQAGRCRGPSVVLIWRNIAILLFRRAHLFYPFLMNFPEGSEPPRGGGGIQPSYRLYGGLPKYTNPTNNQFSVRRFIRVGHIPSRAIILF